MFTALSTCLVADTGRGVVYLFFVFNLLSLSLIFFSPSVLCMLV